VFLRSIGLSVAAFWLPLQGEVSEALLAILWWPDNGSQRSVADYNGSWEGQPIGATRSRLAQMKHYLVPLDKADSIIPGQSGGKER